MIDRGTLVGRRYRVTDKLARGGMAELWTAEDGDTGLVVVIKTPRASLLGRADLLQLFEREATLMARIQSRHVPRFYGYFKEGKQPCIVCERLLGETLGDRIKRMRVMTLADLGPIVDQVLTGLSDSHAVSVLHRDLSPANVFITEGTPESTKIIDFGVGKVEGSESMTPADATIGSFAYMAPEQWLDPSNVDARADLYALGTIIFHALTGGLPFPEKNAMRMLTIKRDFDAPQISEVTNAPYPADVSAFVAKTLARDRSQRFASADEMRAAWKAVFESSAGSAPAIPVIHSDDGGDTTATMMKKMR